MATVFDGVAMSRLGDERTYRAQRNSAAIDLKILQRIDGPVSGYEIVIVEIEVEAGTTVPRHTHPGIESTYVVEGVAELTVNGQLGRCLKSGEAFQVPRGVVHSVAIGDQKAKACSTLVVEKGKPLVSPV